MRHIILGTAGHVDHGKTSLIRALTGLDTDRLPEEKERGLTIELGFAPFKLKDGTKIGVIDVPGHERFIKNMLAGITSIDLVLFVIALDEGIMPQSEEHLNIIDLLGLKNGLVVLTKSDLVDDEIKEMVKEDVKNRLATTSLANCPIVIFSAATGEGLDEVVETIQTLIKRVSSEEIKAEELSANLVRMPIDRVFSKSGHGTIVTGTLIDGVIQNGDKLELMPDEKTIRVRQIQVHEDVVERAIKGQRVALNLAGVDKEEIEKGMMIASPKALSKSRMLDVEIKVIESGGSILNRQRLRLHHGSSEVMCRIRILGADAILPGETAFAQLELESDLAGVHSDKFIVRTYSPPATIGGGRVLFGGSKRLKRLDEKVLMTFNLLSSSIINDAIEGCFRAIKAKEAAIAKTYVVPIKVEELARNLAIKEDVVQKFMVEKENESKYIKLETGTAGGENNTIYYVYKEDYDLITKDICDKVDQFHRANQLSEGITRDELRTKYYAYLDPKIFIALLGVIEKRGQVQLSGNNVASVKFNKPVNSEMDTMIKFVEECYKATLFTPPDKAEVIEKSKKGRKAEEVFKFLLNNRKLVRVGSEMIFHATAIEKACEIMKELDKSSEGFTLAQFRDATNATRKYAMALLEYFDGQKKTKRVGDARKYIG